MKSSDVDSGFTIGLGVIFVGYADMNKDNAVMAITLTINRNLEKVGVVEDCRFWLTRLNKAPTGDKPSILLDLEHKAIAIFGETYGALWIFRSEEVFNGVMALCDDTSFSVDCR